MNFLALSWLLPLSPLFSAALLLAGGYRFREPIVRFVSGMGFVVSLLLSLGILFQFSVKPTSGFYGIYIPWQWMRTSFFNHPASMFLDFSSLTMTLVILMIFLAIHVFFPGDTHGKIQPHRLWGMIDLLGVFCMVFLTGGTYLVTFLGWCGLSLSVFYLFVVYTGSESRYKINIPVLSFFLISDAIFLISIMFIYSKYGSLEYHHVLNLAKIMLTREAGLDIILPISGLFLSVGIKMAIFPFFKWILPVVELPSPARVTLFSLIMPVGVFVFIRNSIFIAQIPEIRSVLFSLGAVSALSAGYFVVFMPRFHSVYPFYIMGLCGTLMIASGLGTVGTLLVVWLSLVPALGVFSIITAPVIDAHFFETLPAVRKEEKDRRGSVFSKNLFPSIFLLSGAPLSSTFFSWVLVLSISLKIFDSSLLPYSLVFIVEFLMLTAAFRLYRLFRRIPGDGDYRASARVKHGWILFMLNLMSFSIGAGSMFLFHRRIAASKLHAFSSPWLNFSPVPFPGFQHLTIWCAALVAMMGILVYLGRKTTQGKERLHLDELRWMAVNRLGIDEFYSDYILMPSRKIGEVLWSIERYFQNGLVENIVWFCVKWSQFLIVFDKWFVERFGMTGFFKISRSLGEKTLRFPGNPLVSIAFLVALLCLFLWFMIYSSFVMELLR